MNLRIAKLRYPPPSDGSALTIAAIRVRDLVLEELRASTGAVVMARRRPPEVVTTHVDSSAVAPLNPLAGVVPLLG